MAAAITTDARAGAARPWYKILYVQVLIAILLGVVVGWLAPTIATNDWIKALGDGFIKLIKMVIAPIIFCNVVSGISHIQDARKVGRVGVKALVYFEIVSSLALMIGLLVGNLIPVGRGLAVNPDAAAVATYVKQAEAQKSVDFVLNIIPDSVVGALARGDILQVLLFAILFGFALMALGERGHRLREVIDDTAHAVFGVIAIVMKAAPLGAFGAMAYTIGKFGPAALGNLVGLIAVFYMTAALFVFGVLGLVVPTGYSFNLDGTNIYMTLATLFIAQALGVDLSFSQQVTILIVAMLTSKGASGVTGAGFITLAATLTVVNPALVPGMAIVFSVDKFMSEVRALTNIIGNGVATVFVSWWEGELDHDRLHANLNKEIDPSDVETAVTTG